MSRSSPERAFQHDMRGNYCWGCGTDNEHGLQLKSYWVGDEAVAKWEPKPHHAAGPRRILNGGIIATLIDCHSIWTAIAAAYRAEGRALETEPLIWYVTASLQVSYLRPTPIDQPIELRAQLKEVRERRTTVTCSVFAKSEECARGEVVAVRVPAAWRQE